MPLLKPQPKQTSEDYLDKIMGNASFVKEYPDRKQRYAVGKSILKSYAKDLSSHDEMDDGSDLSPMAGETYSEFMKRFIADASMAQAYPDMQDRIDACNDIYESEADSQYNPDDQAGTDSEPIAPALQTAPEEPEMIDDGENMELKGRCWDGYGPVAGVPAGTKGSCEKLGTKEGGGTPILKRRPVRKGEETHVASFTIPAVSVLTSGTARGHNLEIDGVTLEQVKECAESYANGVKVNENHGAGIGDIIGKLNNFRIDDSGTKLLADLTFLDSREDRAKYYMDLAKSIPESFGISISFSGESEKNKDGLDLARCSELYSADLVQNPASNPTGLFSAKNSCIAVDSNINDMQTKPDTDITEGTDAKTRAQDALKPATTFETFDFEALIHRLATIEDRIAKMEGAMATQGTSGEKDEGNPTEDMGAFPFTKDTQPTSDTKNEKKMATEYSAKSTATTELSAVLGEIKRELGKIASAPIASGSALEVKAPTTFAELVNFEMKQSNISKGDSLRLCVGKYNDQYIKELNAGGIGVI